MAWFVSRNGEQFGPFDEAPFTDMIREGRIGAADLIYDTEGTGAWTPADKTAIWQQHASGDGNPPPFAEASARTNRPEPQPGITANATLMTRALETLSGKWGSVIGALIGINVISIFAVIVLYGLFHLMNVVADTNAVVAMSGMVGLQILWLLLGVALWYGICVFFLMRVRKKSDFSDFFSGFGKFGRAFGLYFWSYLFVLLWTLLFIIPGLIATLSYSMAYYIAIDYPALSTRKALAVSRRLMNGYKWKFICFNCRFIGWYLLSMYLTCGIGFLWLFPYYMTSLVHFYEDLKRNLPLDEWVAEAIQS